MKTRFIAFAVAATMGLGSVSAFAQDYHRGDRGAGAWQHQGGEHGRRDSGYGNHYAGPRDYGRSYDHRRGDDGNVVGAVVLGAIAGALLGQATNSYNYSQPPAAYYNPQAQGYYTAPSQGYYSAPAQGYYSQPAPVYYNAPAQGYYNPGYGYYGN